MRRTPSALIQSKDQSVFMVQNVAINRFGKQREYLPTSAATQRQRRREVCLQSPAPTQTGANVFIPSREMGEFSLEFERGTNMLPVVPDSQNLFWELLLPELPG